MLWVFKILMVFLILGLFLVCLYILFDMKVFEVFVLFVKVIEILLILILILWYVLNGVCFWVVFWFICMIFWSLNFKVNCWDIVLV